MIYETLGTVVHTHNTQNAQFLPKHYIVSIWEHLFTLQRKRGHNVDLLLLKGGVTLNSKRHCDLI